ncbi:NAD-P-binding protein [Trametes cingulata]|nr:NAD-P-binding protein [Trametes cingulata]
MLSYVGSACYAALSRVFGTSASHRELSKPVKVFLVGATGYIGGSVLTDLLNTKEDSTLDITVLTRSPEKAQLFERFGVSTVVGSLDDVEKLEAIAEQSDVVIECADADHIASTKAFLAGFRKRYEKTGKTPLLIHTSGTAVLNDNAAGMYGTDTIYYDSDPEQLEAIPPTQPHQAVHKTVVAADKEGYVRTYMILPPTIYGLASGPLVDAGIIHRRSNQIPALIRASVDRRQAGMVGAGKNFHPNVHIDDGALPAISRSAWAALTAAACPYTVAQLYRTILESALSGADIGHGREGYYFAENGEHNMLDIAKAMGAALKDMGLAVTVEPSTFTKEELNKYFGGSESLGTNVRCRAERSRTIGWKPVKTTTDMLASIRPEIEDIRRGGR